MPWRCWKSPLSGLLGPGRVVGVFWIRYDKQGANASGDDVALVASSRESSNACGELAVSDHPCWVSG
jgi:hypothetical protein